ncbi:hypothetical protein SAMN05428989_3239 [Pseudoxanthomonas sp. GM95]|nr:hypothetical protein SAMN05428989_3239 [Pseudoxanthomonas sp. GM95]
MLWPRDTEVSTVAEVVGMSPAAQVAVSKPLDERRLWLQQAVDARPFDVLVARFVASGCVEAGVECDASRALDFLLKEEGDNAAVQLMAFVDAQRRHDAAAERRYWKAAAMADRYDAGMVAFSGLLADAVDGFVAPRAESDSQDRAQRNGEWAAASSDPAQSGLTTAMSVWAGSALPAFAPVTRQCAQAKVREDAERLEECKAIFALMAHHADDLVSKSIALRMMMRLTEGTPQELAWREEQRQLRWLMAQAMQLQHEGVVPLSQFVEWSLRDGELVANQRLLDIANVPQTAPAGWQPQSLSEAVMSTSG